MSKHEIGCLNHCPRGGDGGKGWLLIVVAVIAVVVAAMCWKARRGIETGLNVAAVIGEVILWVLGVAFALGVAAGVFLAARAIVRRVQAARAARPQARIALPEPVHRITQLSSPAPAAIEPPRPRWYPSRPENWVRARPAARSPRSPEPAEVDDGNARNHSQFR